MPRDQGADASVDLRWGVVWIVGASSGIGRALARRMQGHARRIAASARSMDALEELARVIPSAAAYPLDVTDADATHATAERIEKTEGPIDLAVLSFGVWHLMDATEFDTTRIRQAVDVNYLGVINTLAPLLPAMIRRKRGHIAIIASVAGFRGLPRAVAYGPTKAALINLAETLKTELAPHGITVSLINPGFVETPMTADNPFPMPGMVTPDFAADRIFTGLDRQRFEILFPTGFGLAMKALRLLPNGLFFWLMRRFVLPRT